MNHDGDGDGEVDANLACVACVVACGGLRIIRPICPVGSPLAVEGVLMCLPSYYLAGWHPGALVDAHDNDDDCSCRGPRGLTAQVISAHTQPSQD